MPARHEMILTGSGQSGAEEWVCPTCGRRMLLRWPPNYEKLVLEHGDEAAIHVGGKGGLRIGLILSMLVILLLLTFDFQSVRLAFIVLMTVPAVLSGVLIMLVITRTTLNVQSFMGAIMAVGVAVANAILFVTFSEFSRREGRDSVGAAWEGGRSRSRAIVMTAAAMIFGMIPMALGLTESGKQAAPLARAVIGGLATATISTLFILPSIYAILHSRSPFRSPSLNPYDPESRYHENS